MKWIHCLNRRKQKLRNNNMYIFKATIYVGQYSKFALNINNLEKYYMLPQQYKEYRLGSPGWRYINNT